MNAFPRYHLDIVCGDVCDTWACYCGYVYICVYVWWMCLFCVCAHLCMYAWCLCLWCVCAVCILVIVGVYTSVCMCSVCTYFMGVCSFVCDCVCVCVVYILVIMGVCTSLCECVGGKGWHQMSLLNQSPPLFFESRSLTEPGGPRFIQVCWQWVLPHCVQLFMWVLGHELSSLCFHSGCFSNWAVIPAPHRDISGTTERRNVTHQVTIPLLGMGVYCLLLLLDFSVSVMSNGISRQSHRQSHPWS